MNTEDTDLRQRLEEATARAAEAEARLAEANARCAELQGQQRELVGALQHQIRNMLTVVRSVAQRSAETSESVEEYAMHLDGRLAAIARVQSDMANEPRAKINLHSLASDELLFYHAKEGEQVEISGPRILLQPQAAGPLGLAFHELATNAIKFGALTRDEGRISVSWQQTEQPEPSLSITWRERGGPPVAPPARRGFGLTLFERMLPYELKAHAMLRFEPAGLLCTIELPLSDRVVSGAVTA